jgi:hypothetical protein
VDGAGSDALAIGRVKINAPTAAGSPATSTPPIAEFDRYLRLNDVAFAPGRVTFDWTAMAQPDRDYTLFLHVFDGDGTMIGQHDAQPFGGGYPTGLWDANERVSDVREVTMPPQARRLRLGWYDSHTGQRLTARKADGTPWPDDTVLVDIP